MNPKQLYKTLKNGHKGKIHEDINRIIFPPRPASTIRRWLNTYPPTELNYVIYELIIMTIIDQKQNIQILKTYGKEKKH